MGYNEDLAIIKGIYEGHSSESLGKTLGIGPLKATERLRHLGLSIRDARKACIHGMTIEEYLETSPLYKKLAGRALKNEVLLKRPPVQNVVIPPATYSSNIFDGFYGLLFVPEDKRESPAFYLYAAGRLEKAAAELREKAGKIMQDKMGGSLKKA